MHLSESAALWHFRQPPENCSIPLHEHCIVLVTLTSAPMASWQHAREAAEILAAAPESCVALCCQHSRHHPLLYNLLRLGDHASGPSSPKSADAQLLQVAKLETLFRVELLIRRISLTQPPIVSERGSDLIQNHRSHHDKVMSAMTWFRATVKKSPSKLWVHL